MKRILSFLTFLLLCVLTLQAAGSVVKFTGKVIDEESSPVAYASILFGSTGVTAVTASDGTFSVQVPEGTHLLRVEMLGYRKYEHSVSVQSSQEHPMLIKLRTDAKSLGELEVVATGVGRLRRSAYNALAVDARRLHNSTQTLGDALATLPGIKLRAAGGLGSDMQLMMDGFGGRQVKVFIDGVPQEGVGRSFSLNNIPINFAERIEVYKGVVPVGFGTDALGGVINIVTGKAARKRFLDASYSYGSFNTHRSYLNFGQTFDSGFTYEVNLFQNYSDNSYRISTPVQIFRPDGTSLWDMSKQYSVKRFHDTFHNEAALLKLGIVNKSWTDRLIFGFTYAHSYKDIQTGVTQDIVYGGKFRKGYSLMPSLEYRKRNLFLRGLDAVATLNYNHNIGYNVDTASYRYNWFGERQPLRAPGEQAYQDNKLTNSNWNSTLTMNYRPNHHHLFTFSHVFSDFERTVATAAGVADGMKAKNAIPRHTRKNISGLSYRYLPGDDWNVSLFAKYYDQYNAGPVLPTGAPDNGYVNYENRVGAWGYGVAATWFPLRALQFKASFEKAYRLPTNDELFGDEDLELGTVGLKPENSRNLNLSLSYMLRRHMHRLYAEAGWIYRDTKDYIQRSISGSYSGGRRFASYINHGKVRTSGYNLSLRYTYGSLLSVGGNLSRIDTRDNVRHVAGSNAPNVTYGVRMPNVPYFFWNTDASLHFYHVGGKHNRLTLSYDNAYVHHYSLYPENLGDARSRMLIPSQFAHNISAVYSIREGKYSFSLECRNFTDAALFDNFNLQKPGRAFYGKVRIYLFR